MKTLKAWWQYLKTRWTSKMPKFFSWLFWISTVLASLQASILVALENPTIMQYLNPHLKEMLISGLNFCVGVGLIAKLTSIKPPEQQEQQPQS